MRLGIYEKAINSKFNLAEKIDIAKAAGFDFIELSVDESAERLARLDWTKEERRQIKKLLEEKEFYFNSMALSGLRKFPYGSHDPITRKKALEITRKAVELAKYLNIRNIQLAAYDVFYEKNDAQTAKWFVEGVRKAVKWAEEESVMLSFEVMDTDFAGTVRKATKLVKKVNSPYLQIYPDIGNLTQHTNDVEAELKAGKPRIVGIHFKDTLPGKFRDVPFGKGNVDFKLCLKTLREMGYAGPYVIEMWSKNDKKEQPSEAIAKILKAKKFFQKNYKNN